MMGLPAEASVFDACRRINPRVFDTCQVLQAMRGCLGVVIRINRKSYRDEGLQNNLAFGALSAHSDLGWVIAVDHDIDISNADNLIAVAAKTGLAADEVRAGINDQAVKDLTKAAVDKALAVGAFGSPYIVVDGEPFWGVDRFDQIEKWLVTEVPIEVEDAHTFMPRDFLDEFEGEDVIELDDELRVRILHRRRD